MKYWKVLCGVGFFATLVSNVWSISGWTEIRGVAMLSLWTVLFATLIPHRESIGDSLAFRQPVKA